MSYSDFVAVNIQKKQKKGRGSACYYSEKSDSTLYHNTQAGSNIIAFQHKLLDFKKTHLNKLYI